MAARGYAVLYPNPRGSTGYGEEFVNIIQYRYPADDFRDLILGVDEAIRFGYTLMPIEGESDLRAPPAAAGEQMFRALKYRRVPTVMVRFPGETHELSRSGNPKHRVERLHHIAAWFDKYLQSRNVTTYDVRQPDQDPSVTGEALGLGILNPRFRNRGLSAPSHKR